MASGCPLLVFTAVCNFFRVKHFTSARHLRVFTLSGEVKDQNTGPEESFYSISGLSVTISGAIVYHGQALAGIHTFRLNDRSKHWAWGGFFFSGLSVTTSGARVYLGLALSCMHILRSTG